MSTVMTCSFASPRLGCLSLKPRSFLLRPVRTPLSSSRKISILAAWKEPNEEGGRSVMEKLTVPVTALVVCALLSGAVLPEEAMAGRSGGRMGGSAFRSRGPSMPRGGGGGYRQYNYYGSPGVAPPLMGGYGYGLGGYGMMPSFFLPIGFGGIFNIFIAMFVINAALNVFREYQRRNDDQDDFDDM